MLCEVQRQYRSANITGIADDTYLNGDDRVHGAYAFKREYAWEQQRLTSNAPSCPSKQGWEIHRISPCIMYNTYYLLYYVLYVYYFARIRQIIYVGGHVPYGLYIYYIYEYIYNIMLGPCGLGFRIATIRGFQTRRVPNRRTSSIIGERGGTMRIL